MVRAAAYIITLLFTLLTTGCSYPGKEYSYCEFDIHNGWNGSPVEFELDITDTLVPLQMDILGHIATDSYLNNIQGYPLYIYFHTPDNHVYADTITLPIHVKRDENILRKGHSCVEILWNYRKNIINNKPGRWKIELAQADTIRYNNIIGLGISVTEYER
ncbi:MAG: hypothetical protein IKT74_05615 [Bacteroidales bacterium]|nr:hypothetical protein [Bacteroidales bacterium]